MKLGVACLLWLLLLCLSLPTTCGRVLERSMEIRTPDIDPSWYTGRGIRPVGRLGRRRVPAPLSPVCASLSVPHLTPTLIAPKDGLSPL
ncbi:prolactin-releasing peptide [Geospiza fortis]|uniref:Prolactin-releasing peptide n=1 Tax=Geospiza fortis TaxID=48883 RepID=A0A8N5I3N6_GEOFO|nr:prolactin-releasing peptide [Geospiza fortis]